MKYVIYTLSDGIESRPISNKNQKLVCFKKGIKREETAYATLKDERYFDGFSRSLYITAKSHECEQVLDPDPHLVILKRTYLKQNRSSCCLCLTNIC